MGFSLRLPTAVTRRGPESTPGSASPPLALRLVIALLAAAPATGAAQPVAAAGDSTGPPARIDNHYDHKAYQPTTGEVCGRASSDSIDCSSRAGKDAAAKLESIQRQLDELAKEQPPDTATGSSGGRR